MSESEAAKEPSMDEILASIRRIISEDDQNDEPADSYDAAEDDDFGAVGEVVEEAAPEAVVEPSAPVVELTQRAEPSFSQQVEPEPEPEPEPVVQEPAYEAASYEPEPEHAQPEPAQTYQPEPLPAPVAAVAAKAEDELLSPQTETRLASALGQLHANEETQATAAATGATVDGLVRELLRPMLREWLDANLPPIVEEIVEREIQRVTRRR